MIIQAYSNKQCCYNGFPSMILPNPSRSKEKSHLSSLREHRTTVELLKETDVGIIGRGYTRTFSLIGCTSVRNEGRRQRK